MNTKLNNWFLQPNMQTDGLITEIKSDNYGIDNNYVNLLERKIDPDFEMDLDKVLIIIDIHQIQQCESSFKEKPMDVDVVMVPQTNMAV